MSISKCKWNDRNQEIDIFYDELQRRFYEQRSSQGIYFKNRWPDNLRQGRNKDGCFPEIAVRYYYNSKGYSVLMSEPRLPINEGYILCSFPGYREKKHPSYTIMANFFEIADLEKLNKKADIVKKEINNGKRHGGDPDLFVFKQDGSEKFFVEVKDNDSLHKNQIACFPLIEDFLNCEIRVARIKKR